MSAAERRGVWTEATMTVPARRVWRRAATRNSHRPLGRGVAPREGAAQGAQRSGGRQ